MDTFILTYSILFLALFIESIHSRYSRVAEHIRTRKRPDKELTEEEFKLVFHRSSTEEIDYDFVNLTTEITEIERKVLFTIDDKDYHLKLTRASSSVIPSGTLIRSAILWTDNQTHFHDEDSTDEHWGSSHIYEDLDKMATFLLRDDDDFTRYDGVFGGGKDMKVVGSLPARLVNIYGANYHFIYYANGSVSDVILNGAKQVVGSANTQAGLNNFYPKLLVLVDYTLFKILNKSYEETIRYLAIFWNAVDMKFKKFETPKINIIITGIIVPKNEGALKHVYDARIKSDMQKVNATKIITNSEHFFGANFSTESYFDNYDATFTMASLNDLEGQTGLAYIGAICKNNHNNAYVKDSGVFSGVLAAAHELGHLLASDHDEDVGCPGEINYNTRLTGTIMAEYRNNNVSKFIWS
uniref:Venom metalloproteinase 2 n=1 Tax=Eulophus pennicornis TaxID=108749 RepID=VMP02_EULPE|nr:RecName: Full=Venom metalloproteinase 2; Short=EpMP2; Flags: Precursor [Eulophus pennicornis]ACF60598.1 metalloproteinase 2 [Eulophus pennicornis]